MVSHPNTGSQFKPVSSLTSLIAASSKLSLASSPPPGRTQNLFPVLYSWACKNKMRFFSSIKTTLAAGSAPLGIVLTISFYIGLFLISVF